MLFNSYEFLLLYLPVVLFGFFLIGRHSHQLAAGWLVAASVFFYGWWNPKFVLLLLGSIAFNFAMGRAISRIPGQAKAKYLLAAAITANLVVLGIFKYFDFFIATVNGVAHTNLSLAGIILPLGISFFTFTQIAFLVDAYRGLAREYSPVHYALFVSYFPHLIAGPVLHHKQMMPQFALPETYRPNWENLAVGLTIFTIGLAKKVLIADNLAPTADGVFGAASEGRTLMFFEAWIGALAYTFQLYFDFSGYSDMAIGLARMFNVKFPLNFNSPYKATSIVDFWRRWHMTLSAFLREYLYFALGGNRKGPVRRYVNILLTMLLGGLWHGASWTFVAWGGLHGLFLAVNHGWRALGIKMWRGPAWCLTFLAVVVSWVFFRADSFQTAGSILLSMSGANGFSFPVAFEHIPAVTSLIETIVGEVDFGGLTTVAAFGRRAAIALGTAAAIAFVLPNTQQLLRNHNPAWEAVEPVSGWLRVAWRSDRAWSFGIAALLVLSIFGFSRTSSFLYFQF
jgi:D-alanyl-lipoteichoic acid acyltransferase DltB (MBOAT superfamily)